MQTSIKSKITILAAILLTFLPLDSRAQFIDSTQGLLLSPSAEMNQEGTFMISNNLLNKHFSPTGWNYNTFGYGFSITFWKRLEVAYVMTMFNDNWNPLPNKKSYTVVNEDRHIAARFQFVREGEFKKWMPSILGGVSDFTTGSGGDYIESNIGKTGNGYFNRMYLAASKHFQTSWGQLGAHASYIYTKRSDFLRNSPTAGLTWEPVWLNRQDSFLTSFRLIAEYDTRNVNVGFTTSIFRDHFEGMFCLEGMRWINAGLRYKLILK